MKIFNWFQSSHNGSKKNKSLQQGSSPSSPYPPQLEIREADYPTWTHGLLAIGTLDTDPIKGEDGSQQDPPSAASHVASDFTIEEVITLQKKLSKLLDHAPKSVKDGSRTGKDRDGEVDGVEVGGDAVDGRLSPESTVMILRKARELVSGGGDRNLPVRRRKSVAFLLKNMLICRGGFDPIPGLRDPILVSRMEKLLRIILYKNIFPQTSDSAELQKYLENKANEKATDEDISEEQESRSCKWDKTDSDFIVLEM